MLRAPSQWGPVQIAPDELEQIAGGAAASPPPVGDSEPRTFQPIALVEPVARSQDVTRQLANVLTSPTSQPMPAELTPPPAPVVVTVGGGGGGAWPGMVAQQSTAAGDGFTDWLHRNQLMVGLILLGLVMLPLAFARRPR